MSHSRCTIGGAPVGNGFPRRWGVCILTGSRASTSGHSYCPCKTHTCFGEPPAIVAGSSFWPTMLQSMRMTQATGNGSRAEGVPRTSALRSVASTRPAEHARAIHVAAHGHVTAEVNSDERSRRALNPLQMLFVTVAAWIQRVGVDEVENGLCDECGILQWHSVAHARDGQTLGTRKASD
jgi:hypothetical protein